VLIQSLSVEQFIMCKIGDLASAKAKEEKKKIIKESFDKSRSDWHILHMGDLKGMHRCGKCKTNKTVFYEL